MRSRGSWRPLMRIARREAWRARGRSALVVLLVALPVLAVAALDTLVRTALVSPVEALPRQLGAADAVVRYDGEPVPVVQNPTSTVAQPRQGDPGEVPPPDEAVVRTVLGADARLLPRVQGRVELRTDAGVAAVEAEGFDLGDPLAAGMLPLRSGRLPRAGGEVVVNERLAGRGLGATLRLEGGPELRVVGTVRTPDDLRALRVVALPGTLALTEPGQSWLVDAPGQVSWDQVRQLNDRGLAVLSRAVVLDPPPEEAVPAQVREPGYLDTVTGAVLGLVVAMALLEVALLAGPAFAVGARRQRRSLALLAATGGDDRHVRRVVLGGAVVLGAVAAAAGAVVGVGAAATARGVVQRFVPYQLGPFEVSLRDLAVVAGFGFASALLAALAPAAAAARQDVLAALTGRRGQGRAGRRQPVLAVLLILGGCAGCAVGVASPSGGDFFVAGAAVFVVLGAVLLTPALLTALGRFGPRMPLPARLAVRDAARQRDRTAPAVAAVVGVVAGVTVLTVGASSDTAQAEATYAPEMPMGVGLASSYSDEERVWPAVRAAVRRELAGADVREIRTLGEPRQAASRGLWGSDYFELCRPADAMRNESCPELFQPGVRLGDTIRVQGVQIGEVAVGDDVETLLEPGLPEPARRALHDGGAVVFADSPLPMEVVLRRRMAWSEAGERQTPAVVDRWTIPVVAVPPPQAVPPVRAVLSEPAAAKLGVPVSTAAIVVRGTDIPPEAEERIAEAARAAAPRGAAGFSVERGYEDPGLWVLLLILGAVAGVLLLGGTLTATLLALAEARADFATLAAVGAAPRVRRSTAACYAAVVGLLGALTGVVAGLVPGVAIAFPLTSRAGRGPDPAGVALPDVFIDVPWLLLGVLVIALPLLSAAVVAATTRSRLPLVRRPG